jgi:6-pyruvoyltetrahydropterin 2'-reductase
MQLKIAEIFYSLQGEGRWAGVPSVFMRTFGCNFQCRGFGLPRGEKTTEPDEIAANVHLYKTYEDLPLARTGCDSYASWHPAFKHLSPFMTLDEIADRMHGMIPKGKWSPDTISDDVHLVITGGEPLLGYQVEYPKLIEKCRQQGLRNITFETNGTQFLHEDVREYLFEEFTRHGRDYDRLTFSVSAKLPCSGERWEDAIRPEVVKSYEMIGMTYLKFVVANDDDLNDVDEAVYQFRRAGFGGPVYLMPTGGVADLYNFNVPQVAELAMKRGYRYSPRLQVDIWRNAWGT